MKRNMMMMRFAAAYMGQNACRGGSAFFFHCHGKVKVPPTPVLSPSSLNGKNSLSERKVVKSHNTSGG
jgi:hypothetical protein